MSSLKDRMEAVKKLQEETRDQIDKICGEAFEAGVGILFETYPELKSFGWRQYTPYFNDGDACYFSVHADEPDINGEGSDEWYDEEGWQNKAADDIAELVYSIDEGYLKRRFDDHAEVTVTRTRNGYKAESDDYRHD